MEASYWQGLNGQQLAGLDDQRLLEKGVLSKLQRMQLLNRRDELMLMDEDNDPDPSAGRSDGRAEVWNAIQ